MTAATIELKGIGKSYGDQRVIDGLNLAIAAQEFVVLLGPSGCGKSTLLRMIAGLEEISSGEMLLDGERCNEVPARRRDFAMVFQSYALYPHMNVADNMSLALRLQKMPRAEIDQKVRAAAHQLGLTKLLKRKPRELSGGQRQRVAMGRALVREPRAFLFDEPLSNLDTELRLKMRAEIKQIHQRLRSTTVYVTHDQVEAMTLADRLVIMRDGEIQQIGAPIEVFNHPRNLFVAGFVGSPPMNFLPGTLRHGSLSVDGDRQILGDFAASPALAANVPVSVGIRPQHLRPVGGERDGGARFALRLKTTVTVIEPLGTEMLVYVDWLGQELLYQGHFDAAIDVGAPFELGVAADHIRVFDAGSGEALKSSRSAGQR